MYRVALIPGDGIGQEVVPAAAEVLAATGVPLTFVELEAGWGVFRRRGTALPEETVEALQACHAALFGAVSSPLHRVAGYRSPIVELRRRFDLFANIRPVRALDDRHSRVRHRGVDLLIVRENTEDLYVGRERVEAEGARVVAERVITRAASERVARVAFTWARRRRQRLTVVHKANVLRESDGLFREVVLAVAAEFPDVVVNEGLVDSVAYRLVQSPEAFDVLVTPNLYGDILSDLAAALVGSLGLLPSGNVGEHFAVFEPVHGSAPDIAGQGIANPLGAIRAAAMLLAYLGEEEAAARVEAAVDRVVEEGPWTPDLGGRATTREVTQAVVAHLKT